MKVCCTDNCPANFLFWFITKINFLLVILFEVEKRLKLNLAEDSKEDDLEGKVSGLNSRMDYNQ